jgi:hypothetical protein
MDGRSWPSATDGRCLVTEPGTTAELPQRIKVVNGRYVPEVPEECEPHTHCPDGYLQRDEWMEQMSETHDQRQCRGCGLWAIWEPKENVGA